LGEKIAGLLRFWGGTAERFPLLLSAGDGDAGARAARAPPLRGVNRKVRPSFAMLNGVNIQAYFRRIAKVELSLFHVAGAIREFLCTFARKFKAMGSREWFDGCGKTSRVSLSALYSLFIRNS
jgi:hypothetical protein